jgi:CubicO group peptidase (beta-lactamase class C family)
MATERAAFANQIGELSFPALIRAVDRGASLDFDAGPGRKWGYGLLLTTTSQPGMRAVGSGGWAGLCNTHFWVDPAAEITAAVYTQALPYAEPRVFRHYVGFETALYASLA